jgi:hypothetical protein
MFTGAERLGHRNLDHLRAGKRKPPRPDLPNEEGRPVERINTPKGPPAFPPKRGDPLLTAHGNIRPYGQVVRLSFWSHSFSDRIKSHEIKKEMWECSYRCEKRKYLSVCVLKSWIGWCAFHQVWTYFIFVYAIWVPDRRPFISVPSSACMSVLDRLLKAWLY